MRRGHPLAAELLAVVVFFTLGFLSDISANSAHGWERWGWYAVAMILFWKSFPYAERAWRLIKDGR